MKNKIFRSYRDLGPFRPTSAEGSEKTGMARKNTEATDASILFERQDFRNVRDIIQHSKASDALTHGLSRIAWPQPAPCPHCFMFYVAQYRFRSPFFSLLPSTISAPSLSQRPARSYFRVQIHPLRTVQPQGPHKAGSRVVVKLAAASLRNSEKKKSHYIRTLVSKIKRYAFCNQQSEERNSRYIRANTIMQHLPALALQRM